MRINFYKEIENDKTKYSPPFHFSSKTQKIINNDLVIDVYYQDCLETSYQIISSITQNWFGESSGLLIESVDGDDINFSIQNLLRAFMHAVT